MTSAIELKGGCFVTDQSNLALRTHGSIKWAQVIGKNDQSVALSQFYLEAHPGTGPAITTGAKSSSKEAVLFLQQGECSVSICEEKFDVVAGTGVYVRPGEHFSLINTSARISRWIISICPRTEDLDFDIASTAKFDRKYPQRTVAGADRKLTATEDRFYKLLVGPIVGSESVTQFIGRIPPSRAPEHFHLYEEAICILSGHGLMWAGDTSTEVKPGSMIFLPRKQPHCLECLDANGMEIMGIFYPAGSPEINYKT